MLFARGISLMPRWTWLASILVIAWSVAGYQYYHSEDVLLFIGGMSKTRNYPALDDYVRQLDGKVRSEDFSARFRPQLLSQSRPQTRQERIRLLHAIATRYRRCFRAQPGHRSLGLLKRCIS